jgi:hypothetical protein
MIRTRLLVVLTGKYRRDREAMTCGRELQYKKKGSYLSSNRSTKQGVFSQAIRGIQHG